MFGSVNDGNWSLSTETLSNQLSSQTSDGKSGYMPGLGNTTGLAVGTWWGGEQARRTRDAQLIEIEAIDTDL